MKMKFRRSATIAVVVLVTVTSASFAGARKVGSIGCAAMAAFAPPSPGTRRRHRRIAMAPSTTTEGEGGMESSSPSSRRLSPMEASGPSDAVDNIHLERCFRPPSPPSLDECSLVDRRRVLISAAGMGMIALTTSASSRPASASDSYSSSLMQSSSSLSPADPYAVAEALEERLGAGRSNNNRREPLEELALGEGRWRNPDDGLEDDYAAVKVPPAFAAYLARFLLNYDPGASAWWAALKRKHSLLPSREARRRESEAFGPFARSVSDAVAAYFIRGNGGKSQTGSLLDSMADRYSDGNGARGGDAVLRQIGLLFGMLPVECQPVQRIAERCRAATMSLPSTARKQQPPPKYQEDFAALLPDGYGLAYDTSSKSYAVTPQLPEIIDGNDSVASASGGVFGPVALSPLRRDRSELSPDIYALLGISGGAGCAVTHSLVIPLDVVKTRIQTDPDIATVDFGGKGGDATKGGGAIWNGAKNIIDNEGVGALFLGAQATIAGYTWYGISVYPSYAFFKLFLAGESVLSPEFAAVHANDVALVAGAMASVVASLGLTPLEAARIRAVAEPEKYRDLGLVGTMGVIASEEPSAGWKALYAGLPSLMTRQVIFGSVKFLAFERACSAIFATFPELREAVFTSLGVSLLAGGFAGVLSSAVSQPADSVLTYVARQSGGDLSVFEGAREMIRENGPSSLFRGLGSRCVWAGCIIAGQFLLYDVFRSMFGITGQDLTQVFEVVIPNR